MWFEVEVTVPKFMLKLTNKSGEKIGDSVSEKV
jgi:hypothetical protein